MTITDREGLDALPIGTILRDRDGFRLNKVSETEYVNGVLGSLDTDELLGTYEGGESMFLPAEIVPDPYGNKH